MHQGVHLREGQEVLPLSRRRLRRSDGGCEDPQQPIVLGPHLRWPIWSALPPQRRCAQAEDTDPTETMPRAPWHRCGALRGGAHAEVHTVPKSVQILLSGAVQALKGRLALDFITGGALRNGGRRGQP